MNHFLTRFLLTLQLVAGKDRVNRLKNSWKQKKNGNEHRKKIHTAMIKKEKTKRKNVNYMDKNKSRYQYI